MSNLVYDTVNTSILIQYITGVFGVLGLFEKVKPQDAILKGVLGWEMVVQSIELLFYTLIIRRISITDMAATRYFDWIITTPTMLITSIVYYKYEETLERFENTKSESDRKALEEMSFTKFIKENKENIKKIVLCNFLMLLFGYLAEKNIINKMSGFILGTTFFLLGFYIIYNEYAKFSKTGRKMFSILLGVWSIYGIASLLNPIYKNTMYNGLDIIAKNFFGLFLYYKIKNSNRTLKI